MDNVVFQVQLAKKRDTLPLTRDYITEWEERLRHEDKNASGDGAAA